MRIVCRDRLPEVEAVRRHLWAHRADLANCVIGFSGGKDSVALAALVHEVEPAVPLLYASCPGCEWPAHEEYVRAAGAVPLATKHDRHWFAANQWAFLHLTAAERERWAARHHRGHLRRYAKSAGKVLLWGNRTQDRNTVAAVRYEPTGGPELWLPIRDLDSAAVRELVWASRLGWSPIYDYPSVAATGYTCSGVPRGLESQRLADVERYAPEVATWFRGVWEGKFGAAV